MSWGDQGGSDIVVFTTVLVLGHVQAHFSAVEVPKFTFHTFAGYVRLVDGCIITGLEYGTERWNGKWNGTVSIYSCS